jgi:hypothetical protein
MARVLGQTYDYNTAESYPEEKGSQWRRRLNISWEEDSE